MAARQRKAKSTRSTTQKNDAVPKRIDQADYSDEIARWMRGVVAGKIVAGRYVRLAVRRHLDDLKHAAARGYMFDAHRANEAIWFIESNCRHTKRSIAAEPGDPLILTAPQKYIVWCVFGWRRSSDGLRRYRSAWIEVARKFGKTTFAAALLLLLLVFDFPLEAEAEIYSAATKERQATIVFGIAKAMIKRSPSLAKRLTVKAKSIIFGRTDGFIQPIGSDSDTQDGMNPSANLKDEVHAWRQRHRGLHEKLDTGVDARLQPLTIVTTTAGDDRSEIYIEEHDDCVAVLNGVVTGEIIDDTMFVFLAAIDVDEHACIECNGTGRTGKRGCKWCDGGTVPADDPFDESVWIKANPNLGQSVDIDKLRVHAARARRKSSGINAFLRYYCNVRVSSSEKAIDPVLWANCSAPITAKPGDYCRGAFDLGRSDDWAAWAIMFAYKITDTDQPFTRYELLTRSYTCESRPERMQTDRVQRWIDDELLIEHPGDQVDFDQIEADIVEAGELYDVQSWAFDPMFAAATSQHLVNEHGFECFKFTQAARWYNEPIRTMQRLVKQRRIAHGGDRLLAWQADNLVITRTARDEWMPDKANSTGKIDAMVSGMMALSECLFHDVDDDDYDDAEIRLL